MTYILTFVKLFDTSPFAGVGFAGNIMMVINALLQIPKESRLWVDMETNNTINTDNSIKFTKNSWEYYFDQIEKPKVFDKTLSIFDVKGKILYNTRKYDNNSPIIKTARNLFNNHFKIKKDIIDEVDEFYKSNMNGSNILGVQIRLTDMANYHKVAGVTQYLKSIQRVMKQQKIDKIFVATDDEEAINYIQANVKVPVISQSNICRGTKDSPFLKSYERFYNTNRKGHRYLLGKEVLIDALLLSKCQYFIKADVSSVSLLSLVFGESIKNVYGV